MGKTEKALNIETDLTNHDKKDATHLQKIISLLHMHTGHDFSLYKKNTIIRRVERRMAFHQLSDYVHYINYIEENPNELDFLFRELLIGVTKFFRDTEAFEVLKEQLYIRLYKKERQRPIKIWVAGCSTGEEAYSIAILVMEYLDEFSFNTPPGVIILATDLDAHAIEYAKLGFYANRIVSDISAERLERFFVKKDDGYQVKDEIREMLVFVQHNLIKDAPFIKLDLLCCRNVLIYFSAELQKMLLPLFHYSLNDLGILFLGPAESVGVFNDSFDVIDPKWKLFERKELDCEQEKDI